MSESFYLSGFKQGLLKSQKWEPENHDNWYCPAVMADLMLTAVLVLLCAACFR